MSLRVCSLRLTTNSVLVVLVNLILVWCYPCSDNIFSRCYQYFCSDKRQWLGHCKTKKNPSLHLALLMNTVQLQNWLWYHLPLNIMLWNGLFWGGASCTGFMLDQVYEIVSSEGAESVGHLLGCTVISAGSCESATGSSKATPPTGERNSQNQPPPPSPL